ncbi:MAG TPA: Rieske 2Fe-2S domain-containing protein [Chloroflexota bacterium]|nr:Rieske 2Fe-2S domain-containing protein [Chloroflexota bacterium]
MLSTEQNERITRVGPGTPCGVLMRRYWHPVAASAQLAANPVQRVKILGEDLVLYRDRSGTLGLIGPRCLHRAVHMEFGIPEECGLRCPYHGWLYDEQGRCLETPLEPPDSTFKDKLRTKAYPAQEMGGLIWGYLGPLPAPILPRWDLFGRPDGFRQILGHRLPCNWLQVQENGGDPGHGVYLHGRFFQYVLEREGQATADPTRRSNAQFKQHQDLMARGAYTRYRPIYNQYGLTKGVLNSDSDEDTWAWQVGVSPVIFPYLRNPDRGAGIRRLYQLGVPIDDTTTWHISYHCYVFPPEIGAPGQDVVPYVDVPIKDEAGNYILDYVLGQDMVAFYSQGDVTDRSEEHLGTSDACIIGYRKLLEEQIAIVEQGGQPMNVFTDPHQDVVLDHSPIPVRDGGAGDSSQYYRVNYHKATGQGRSYIEDDVDRYCPDKELIKELYARTEQLASRQAQELGSR